MTEAMAPAGLAVRAAIRAAQRAEAWRRHTSVRSLAFRTLARERGLNSSTRDEIMAEAEAAGRQAAYNFYVGLGYRPCSDPIEAGCVRLASPGFDVCPWCGDRDGNALTL